MKKSIFTQAEREALDQKKMPKHIAIVMDGNRRWAKLKGKNTIFGHRAGAKALENIILAAIELSIPYLTVYAFSTENWKRSEEEVTGLFSLFDFYLRKKIRQMKKRSICFQTIGNDKKFPLSLQTQIQRAKEETQEGKALHFSVALNYGGRDEICRAVTKIMQQNVKNEIDENLFEQYLDTSNSPQLDLFIRAGGEQRISNFLLWQTSYAEIIFEETLWPDFSPAILYNAICEYQRRERRRGK